MKPRSQSKKNTKNPKPGKPAKPGKNAGNPKTYKSQKTNKTERPTKPGKSAKSSQNTDNNQNSKPVSPRVAKNPISDAPQTYIKLPPLTIQGKRDLIEHAIKKVGAAKFTKWLNGKDVKSIRELTEHVRRYKSRFFREMIAFADGIN